jgi:hypothetical protein
MSLFLKEFLGVEYNFFTASLYWTSLSIYFVMFNVPVTINEHQHHCLYNHASLNLHGLLVFCEFIVL